MGTSKILIVEDEPNMVAGLRDNFEYEGFQVITALDGVEGLERDKTRPARKKPLSKEVRLKIIAKTANERPANATHWSARAMAKEVGVSHISVQRIWAKAGLKPHLVRKFKLANDPQFRGKGHGCRRPVSQSPGQGVGVVHRRKEPDSSAGSHAAWFAHEKGPSRDE